MDKRDILLSVAKYCVMDSTNLKGKLGDWDFFKIRPIPEGPQPEGSNIVRGYAIDIVADLIERDKFFGDYIPEQPNQAANPGGHNARIYPLEPGSLVWAEVEGFDRETKQLILNVNEIPEKSYMDPLRTKEDFINYSELVDVRGDFKRDKDTDVRKVIDSLFN